MRRGVFAGIGAIIVVVAGGTVWGLVGTRASSSDTLPTPTAPATDSVMHVALNSHWEQIVNQMGKHKATELHLMLTRDTLIMDRFAFADDGPPTADPQAERVIQSDYNQLLKMFPEQVKEVRANPQLVYNMVPGGDAVPVYIVDQATGKGDWVAGVVGMLYEADESAVYDMGPAFESNSSKRSPMQSLNPMQAANLVDEMNRILFGGELDTSTVSTTASTDSALHSALNNHWEQIVNQIGKSKATELHVMLTRDTIIMDKEAFSDEGGKWLLPNPQTEKQIQTDYNQLLKMFPKQVKAVQANPQLVYNMNRETYCQASTKQQVSKTK